jgi:hypothetical protein
MRSFQRLLWAGAMALSCGAPVLAADPTMAGLAVRDANLNVQNEAVFSYGGFNYLGHLDFGWDYTNLRPKAWSIDPTTGQGLVFDSQAHADAQAVAAAAGNGLTVAQLAAQTVSTNRVSGAYAESTVSLAAATWTNVAALNVARVRLAISDTVGLACRWSFNDSPGAGEGFVFSTTGNPNTWVFEEPTPTNAIYVYCASAGAITVGSF